MALESEGGQATSDTDSWAADLLAGLEGDSSAGDSVHNNSPTGAQETSSLPSGGPEESTANGNLREEKRDAGQNPRKRQKTGEEGPSAPMCPPHPGSIRGMCTVCGKDVEQGEISGISLKYISTDLHISSTEATRLRDDHLKRLIGMRKLLLVLDLDQTLLNTAHMNEVPPESIPKLEAVMAREAELPQRELHRLPHMAVWTKLRPGIFAFLEAAHRLYELHVYTHGNFEYAKEMAQLLDPTHRLFAERVISQRDSTNGAVKNLDVVLGAESAAIILDDTEGVWPEHRANLLHIERYIYFPDCARRFQIGGPSLLEEGRDESAETGSLACHLRVLQEVHRRIFDEGGEPDVRRQLADIRKGLLEGVVIVFSAVIPLQAAEPRLHRMWRLAVQMGAVVETSVSEATTHIVANATGTDKVRWGLKHGRKVVSSDWLLATGALWKRADEAGFPAKNVKKPALEKSIDDVLEDARLAMAAAGGGIGKGNNAA